MKKQFVHALCVAALMSTALASCSSDDDPVVEEPLIPAVTNGAFLLNQGNYSNKIEGSLNLLDFTTSTMTRMCLPRSMAAASVALPVWCDLRQQNVYRNV